MYRSAISASVLAAALALGTSAFGQQTVTPGTSGFERVQGGVFDLGLENILLVHWASSSESSDASVSNLYAAYVGGVAPRYFLRDNLALGASLNVLYQLTSASVTSGSTTADASASDLGFIGFITINYYVRLGHSLFFKPGLGLGGFYGVRDVPVAGDPDLETSTSIYGGAGRVDLGFVYYAGAHFNLRAGIDIIIRAGVEDPEEGEGSTFISTDAGFGAGLGYSF